MSSLRILAVVAASLVLVLFANWLFQTLIIGGHQRAYLGAAHLAQGLSDVSAVRRAVTQHYAELGRLPADNRALGLGAPDTFARDATQSLAVRDGRILVRFTDAVAEGGMLAFTPSPSRSGTGNLLVWDCQSAGIGIGALEMNGLACEAVDTIREQPVPRPQPAASVEELVNAIHRRRAGRVRELIDSGVSVNAAWQNLLPLALAIEQNDAPLVELLLDAGAETNRRLASHDDMTMLAYAASMHRRNAAIVDLLIRAGAGLNSRDAKGRTPLMLAAHAGNDGALNALLRAGAEVMTVDHRGNSVRNYAARHGTGSRVYRLLEPPPQQPPEVIVVIPERN